MDETEKSPTYDYAKKVAVRAGGQLEFAVPALSFVRDSDRQAEEYVKDLAGKNENAYTEPWKPVWSDLQRL